MADAKKIDKIIAMSVGELKQAVGKLLIATAGAKFKGHRYWRNN